MHGRDGLCQGVGIIPGTATSLAASNVEHGLVSGSEPGVSVRRIPVSHKCDIPHPVYSAAGIIWCR